MYIATKYIGKKYTPGEILPDNLPDDDVKWLLEAGAIRRAAPVPGRAIVPGNDTKNDDEPAERETPDSTQEPGAYSDNMQESETLDEATDDENADEPEDEIDEEAEVPEIDVMDGLVPASDEKPAATAARRTANKKGGKTK